MDERSTDRLRKLLGSQATYASPEGWHQTVPSVDGPPPSAFAVALRRASDPVADAYGNDHEARWPTSQRAWERHLTEAVKPLDDGDRPTRSKIRAAAKRLHIEHQTLSAHSFTLKYARVLPDLDWQTGPKGDRYLYRLGVAINGLTGPGSRRPEHLHTLPEVGDMLGLSHSDLWRVIRHFDVQPVRAGDDVRLSSSAVDYIRRGLLEGQ